MPIVTALMLLWIGTFLDMASTYILVVLIGDGVREVNHNFVAANGDFLLVNFLTINGVFLLVFSLATVFALRKRNLVKKYIRETGYGAHVTSKKDLGIITAVREALTAHARGEITSKKDLAKEDRRVASSVSTIVFVGSIGGARFLFFVNNLTEYYASSGIMSLFLRAFPAVHDQLALIIVFVIAATAFQPISYLLLRLTAR